MWNAKVFAAACLAVAVSGLAVPAWAEFQTLTGTVAYREKIALPPGALVEITLEDVSLADAKAVPLGMVTVKAGPGVPVDFALTYDDQMVMERHRYAVRALIRVEDKVMWRSTQSFPALTQDAPDTVDVVVQMMPNANGLDLQDTAWNVVGLDGEPVAGDRVPSMAFDAQGRVSGSSGCNRFTGSFEFTGEKLSFGPLASTRMACPGELGTLETRFFKALAAVSTAHAEGTHLVLKSADGHPLIALVAQ